MKTVQIKLYQYSELSEKAKEKAMANYTNKNSHNKKYYDFLRSRIQEIKQESAGQQKEPKE